MDITQWPSRHDPGPAGEEVLAHEVLEDAALAGALAAHHGDLGEVQADGYAGGGEHVLQPVDVVDHVTHALALQHPAFCLPVDGVNNLWIL